MTISNNRWILHINGYLDAISDIDISLHELSMGVGYIADKEKSIENLLKPILALKKVPKIIKIKDYVSYSLDYLLEKLLLVRPFEGLYQKRESDVAEDIVDKYRHSIIFHLSDYIDFVFEEDGIDISGKHPIQLLLLEAENKYFIALHINIKNNHLIFYFSRKSFNLDDFIDWFNAAAFHHEQKEAERKKENEMYEHDTSPFHNFTNDEVDEIKKIIDEAVEKGHLNKKMKRQLSKYITEEKIIEFEKSLHKN